jgi:osmotically inducible lipoprotein OsmB
MKSTSTGRGLIAAALTVAAFAAGGCSTWDGMSRQDKATVGGAAAGGVIGNAVGGGVLGTVGGAAAGGLIGNQVGKDRR